ncbi:MAG: preprotein translocase subunit SecA [Defluviitaleaceae bacterium]|nr:preprotein translocase subunit SecA [Defluviitaleaceae bacterium]MCL2263209.1 preprotein translocase subunit SecA [Defluviitaleaceae bacterium]
MGLLDKIFGNYSDKEIKRLNPVIDRIEGLEQEMQRLTEGELRGKTDEFKRRFADGTTLDDLMPEAFAVFREATQRLINQRHFRVQLLGGAVLHQGRIAEMKTGEGKTQTVALPLYLNAIEGKGAHLVTVNEYLATYHAEMMGVMFEYLGLTVGCIIHDLKPPERRDAYACDITYATNNELGFDYLRDNMVVFEKDKVQRGLHYAIIDEVDSILIDEARTPLIISGQGSKSTSLYSVADRFAKGLKKGRVLNEEEMNNPLLRQAVEEEGDFIVDEKKKTVTLTQDGVKKAERFFNIENLSDPDNIETQHHINNALKANHNMHRDVNYVSKDNEIIIVDEFTGRLMPGRRYSDGLHQAIEAKEGVKVQRESKTLATVTFQNFFNRYTKKAGATGTAITEEGEFREIYGLDVVAVPTNKPMIRDDKDDVIFRTEAAKYNAIVQDIEESHAHGQPVLVGTVSIEKSELVSALLKKKGIPHEVLNAKHHEREAEIIAKAGQAGHVTIATNMAGRGTDIMLGEGVVALGGLKVIGSERHESRRIDNQLRGRAGRQGDPGTSRFYLSAEDELLRLFGGDRMKNIMSTVGMGDDDILEFGMLTRVVENAQKKVEGNNFGIRKHLLQYDQVMNEQREIIYGERNKVIEGADLRSNIFNMIRGVINRTVDEFTAEGDIPEEWDTEGLNKDLLPIFHENAVQLSQDDMNTITKEQLKERLIDRAGKRYEKKESEITPERMREIERVVMMKSIDRRWMDHIDEMDQMRQGISLRSYAQRDPLVEYKFLSFDMFEEMSNNIQLDTVRVLFSKAIVPEQQLQMVQTVDMSKISTNSSETATVKTPTRRTEAKVGRNDVCPCGSGKKFKQCCISKAG